MAKVGEIKKRGLTKSEFKTLRKVKEDPFHFSNFIHVINPVHGRVRFGLYPYQKRTLWYFLTQRFNIVLKFRQAGLTELISMYCLWLAMFHPNKNIQIISIKDRVAKKVLKKIKFMYKNLPEYMQVAVVNGRSGEYGTAQEMEFANGSLITSIPTTEDAGRSEAVSLLVIDEAAIVRWANTIWAAAFPTLSTGGSAILNSTPYGVGNFFHSTWVDAIAGGNDFNPIRLHWQMHPDRDQKWYDTMAAGLGPRRTAQEIDGDFLSSGHTVFDLEDIKAIEDMLTEWKVVEKKRNGTLVITDRPKPNKYYYIGADVATGRSRDYSAFSIMDREGNECGYFKGKIPVGDFADLLMYYGRMFNNALIAPETNDIGLAVTTKIQESGYPNLYYTVQFLKKKGKSKPEEQLVPGWLTTGSTRPVIIDALEDDVRRDLVLIKDPFFVQEAYTFIYNNNNKAIALGKDDAKDDDDEYYTDDAILAKAITNHVRKSPLRSSVVTPR